MRAAAALSDFINSGEQSETALAISSCVTCSVSAVASKRSNLRVWLMSALSPYSATSAMMVFTTSATDSDWSSRSVRNFAKISANFASWVFSLAAIDGLAEAVDQRVDAGTFGFKRRAVDDK